MQPIPTINVNLKPCQCPWRWNTGIKTHDAACPASTPILIPCPIPPSVTFEVRFGDCDCFPSGHKSVPAPPMRAHSPQCASQPVRVSCSISGKTWEESDVGQFEWQEGPSELMAGRIEVLVAQRWALVKALVLGRKPEPYESEPEASLIAQRDAVYAALADMARAEEAVWKAQERACRTMEPTFIPDNVMNAEPHSRPSASILERYVERLIETIGVLS